MKSVTHTIGRFRWPQPNPIDHKREQRSRERKVLYDSPNSEVLPKLLWMLWKKERFGGFKYPGQPPISLCHLWGNKEQW